MTDRQPHPDVMSETGGNAMRPSAAMGAPAGTLAPAGGVAPSGDYTHGASPPDVDLVQDAGVAPDARSQWSYVRMRFLRHKLAVASLVVLLLIALVGAFAPQVAPYAFDDIDLTNINSPPTLEGKHLFGTDSLGRDYLSRVIYGVRTSLWVAVFVALFATALGTTIGGLAGYYGRHVDNILMRFTDLILTLPFLAVLLTASVFFGSGDPFRIGVILALLFWVGLARIVRGLFLSLREKEFVEAAKAAGAGDLRIMIRHILPNCVGPIVVFTTLIVAGAILVEAALSFLGFGIQPPNAALGKLIADGQQNGIETWWLVTFPGITIVLIALCINFIGDGLRDALDPTQRRTRA